MIHPCLEVLLFWQYLDDHEFDIFGIGILFRDKKRQVLFDYLCSEVVIYDVILLEQSLGVDLGIKTFYDELLICEKWLH